MRRLSTVYAFAAGMFTALAGVYVAQAVHPAPPAQALASKAGFSPNALLSNSALKTETWDAF